MCQISNYSWVRYHRTTTAFQSRSSADTYGKTSELNI